MIYIETNSTDVFENFAIEYYFAKEKTLPETVFLFLAHHSHPYGGKISECGRGDKSSLCQGARYNHIPPLFGRRNHIHRYGRMAIFIYRTQKAREIEFHEYIAPVIDALKSLGVEAAFNGRNDLTIDGKKFSGNAQYRFATALFITGRAFFHRYRADGSLHHRGRL